MKLVRFWYRALVTPSVDIVWKWLHCSDIMNFVKAITGYLINLQWCIVIYRQSTKDSVHTRIKLNCSQNSLISTVIQFNLCQINMFSQVSYNIHASPLETSSDVLHNTQNDAFPSNGHSFGLKYVRDSFLHTIFCYKNCLNVHFLK